MIDINILRKKVAQILNKKRFKHTLSVEKTAIKLAKIYGANEKKVAIAALLHDIAKHLSDKRLLIKAKKAKIKIDKHFKNNPHLLHGPVSAIIAKEEFKIKDKNILNAIKYHTTGRPKMSLLEKIIYLSDHIEPNRNYKNVKKIRKIAKKDIDMTIALVSNEMLKYLLEKKREIYPASISTRNYYINKATKLKEI